MSSQRSLPAMVSAPPQPVCVIRRDCRPNTAGPCGAAGLWQFPALFARRSRKEEAVRRLLINELVRFFLLHDDLNGLEYFTGLVVLDEGDDAEVLQVQGAVLVREGVLFGGIIVEVFLERLAQFVEI